MPEKQRNHSCTTAPEGAIDQSDPPTVEATGQTKKSPRLARRDITAIQKRMCESASAAGQAVRVPPQAASRKTVATDRADVGLTLQELEERRWSVSPQLARLILLEARLPHEGRRAGLIYSWRSIFRAEGVEDDVAAQATRQTHPELFEDLLDTGAAAAVLGYRDSSSARKLVASGAIPESAYIIFGNRGIYRFRPAGLRGLLRPVLTGRIV